MATLLKSSATSRKNPGVQPAGLLIARVPQPGTKHFPFCAQVDSDGNAGNFSNGGSWLAQFPSITPFSVALVPAPWSPSSERKHGPGRFCEVGRGLLISSIWSGLELWLDFGWYATTT